jgi:hypothetical protein
MRHSGKGRGEGGRPAGVARGQADATAADAEWIRSRVSLAT